MQRAGFLIRFLASIIDWIALIVIQIGVVYLYASLTDTAAPVLRRVLELLKSEDARDNINAISGIVGLIYFSTEVLMERTPGKALLGLWIARADGYRASWQHLLMRFFIKYPSFIGMIVFFSFAAVATALIGISQGVSLVLISLSAMTMIAFGIVNLVMGAGCLLAISESRQAMHDRIANTAVYHSMPAEKDLGEAHNENGLSIQSRRSNSRAVDELIFK